MKNNHRTVIVIGPFPPPIFGLATTNAAIYKILVTMGADVTSINTAGTSLDLSIINRLKRISNIIKGVWKLAWMRIDNKCATYMSISGGFGQIYEILFIGIARVKGADIYLRHASFAYLDSPRFITRILVGIAGNAAMHITQCDKMASRLSKHYHVQRVIAISNAVLYSEYLTNDTPKRSTVRVLGFLSNISAEKGVFEYLDLLKSLEGTMPRIQGKLAGPFQDVETKNAVLQQLKDLNNVEYVGSKYGDDKDSFFKSIDVFIFPTKYRNETEAKVNHEVMSFGIPIIAYGRGCIPEVVDSFCGKVIAPEEPFVPAALEQIAVWANEPTTFQAASKAAAQRFSNTYARNLDRWQALLDELSGNIVE